MKTKLLAAFAAASVLALAGCSGGDEGVCRTPLDIS